MTRSIECLPPWTPRADYAAENVAVLRHSQRVPGAELRSAVALNLLHQQRVKRQSIKGRRLKAAWDTDFLLQVHQCLDALALHMTLLSPLPVIAEAYAMEIRKVR